MSSEPVRVETSWSARLGAVPNWAAIAAVVGVVLIGLHGIVHVLPAPTDHLQVSVQGVLIVLWGLTTLVALGGLAALAGAYTSLASELDAEPRVDLEILPDDERHILVPVLDTPGVTQVEVVDRSSFSDAKVSQTLKALRERGLVYREPQGRTYRLYPGTRLDETTSEF